MGTWTLDWPTESGTYVVLRGEDVFLIDVLFPPNSDDATFTFSTGRRLLWLPEPGDLWYSEAILPPPG